MKKPKHYNVSTLQVFILAVIAMLVELFASFYSESFQNSLQAILQIHLAVIFTFSLLVFYQYKKGYDLKAAFLLMIITIATGPFGIALCLITIAIHHQNMKYSKPFNEWVSMFFPEEEVDEDEKLIERLAFGLEDLGDKGGIIPFADIIALGTDDQKRIVLSKLTKHFKPEFSSTLLMALKNPSSPIRVQAATSITRLEENFADNIMSLEKKLNKAKGQHKENILEDLAAKSYDYAYSGLIDSKQAENIRQKTILYYQELLDNKKLNDLGKTHLIKLYLDQNHIKEAYNIAKKNLKNKSKKAQILALYMECLFRMKKYNELRRFSKENLNKVSKNDSEGYFVYENMKLWSEGLTTSLNIEA